MAFEAFIPLVLAPQRQQSQLVTLMIPAMVPGLSPTARSVAMGVTATTAVNDAENRTVAAVTQAVDATTQVSTRPTRALSDADLSSRPGLAAAVQASPALRDHIAAAANQIGALVDQEKAAAVNQAVDAMTKVPGAKFNGDDLAQFPDIARAIVSRGVTAEIVKAADVDDFNKKFETAVVAAGG